MKLETIQQTPLGTLVETLIDKKVAITYASNPYSIQRLCEDITNIIDEINKREQQRGR